MPEYTLTSIIHKLKDNEKLALVVLANLGGNGVNDFDYQEYVVKEYGEPTLLVFDEIISLFIHNGYVVDRNYKYYLTNRGWALVDSKIIRAAISHGLGIPFDKITADWADMSTPIFSIYASEVPALEAASEIELDDYAEEIDDVASEADSYARVTNVQYEGNFEWIVVYE